MTRFLAILAALTCAASAQTYRTVTADTNNVIRTNFTLGAAQVSGSFAISNVTGLQSALDGKLATNGSAADLTNFPSLLLTTNSSESVFPSALLRTNGDGSGLTNLPNANLTNATGVLGLANGGTGQTNAALAISNLLPSYTGNSNRILALNSNATSLVWTTNSGGGGGGGGVTTNLTIQTIVSNDEYETYTNRTDFVNAAGTNNAYFDDDLTNAVADLYFDPLVRTNSTNSVSYSLYSDGFNLIGVAKGSQIWISDGSEEAVNLIWSTTNTNVGSVGLYIFATDLGNSSAVYTNAICTVVVNGANTSTITTVSSNSFFGVVHTGSITNITFNFTNITRWPTTRGVFVSTTIAEASATNIKTLQIGDGSITNIVDE